MLNRYCQIGYIVPMTRHCLGAQKDLDPMAELRTSRYKKGYRLLSNLSKKARLPLSVKDIALAMIG